MEKILVQIGTDKNAILLIRVVAFGKILNIVIFHVQYKCGVKMVIGI